MSRRSTSQRQIKGPSQRQFRVSEIIRRALSELFQRNVIADPKLSSIPVTVTEVRISPDLKLATCYIVPLGGQEMEEVVKRLNHHASFIRGEITSKLYLKFMPRLRFVPDDTFDKADAIDRLLMDPRVQKDVHHVDNEPNNEDTK